MTFADHPPQLTQQQVQRNKFAQLDHYEVIPFYKVIEVLFKVSHDINYLFSSAPRRDSHH